MPGHAQNWSIQRVQYAPWICCCTESSSNMAAWLVRWAVMSWCFPLPNSGGKALKRWTVPSPSPFSKK